MIEMSNDQYPLIIQKILKSSKKIKNLKLIFFNMINLEKFKKNKNFSAMLLQTIIGSDYLHAV